MSRRRTCVELEAAADAVELLHTARESLRECESLTNTILRSSHVNQDWLSRVAAAAIFWCGEAAMAIMILDALGVDAQRAG